MVENANRTNSMKIEILAFGIAKDIIGQTFFSMQIEEGTTAGDLKNQLRQKFPAFSKLSSLVLAVNQEYREDDFELTSGDEVAIIPPVSGG